MLDSYPESRIKYPESSKIFPVINFVLYKRIVKLNFCEGVILLLTKQSCNFVILLLIAFILALPA